jgi:hypothetical protein
LLLTPTFHIPHFPLLSGSKQECSQIFEKSTQHHTLLLYIRQCSDSAPTDGTHARHELHPPGCPISQRVRNHLSSLPSYFSQNLLSVALILLQVCTRRWNPSSLPNTTSRTSYPYCQTGPLRVLTTFPFILMTQSFGEPASCNYRASVISSTRRWRLEEWCSSIALPESREVQAV